MPRSSKVDPKAISFHPFDRREMRQAALPQLSALDWAREVALFYSVSVDQPVAIVTAVLHGFWTVETAGAYWKELLRAGDIVSAGGSKPKFLIDARGLEVQSQDVVDFNTLSAADPRFSEAKAAFVVVSALSGRQASRIKPAINHQAFKVLDDARKWLMA